MAADETIFRWQNLKLALRKKAYAAPYKQEAAYSYYKSRRKPIPRRIFRWRGLFFSAFIEKGGGIHALSAYFSLPAIFNKNTHAILACHLSGAKRLPGWHGQEA